MAFEDILGNEDAKRYFNKSLKEEHLGHSYIFEGPYGVGKKTFAKEVAKIILCEDRIDGNACNKCGSCHMINVGTHPDMITVQKDTKVIKVDTIREKIVREMDIKPYRSDYKIIIIESADSMNVQGQNTLLKTIEEPPSYGIIILIVENIEIMLPTIKSRCIDVRFNPINKDDMQDYLVKKAIPRENWSVYTKLANGSIGIIDDIVSDENYLEIRKMSAEFLKKLDIADLIEVYDIVEEVVEQKEYLDKIFNFWLQWYRDLAVLKSTGSDELYFVDYYSSLLDMSNKLTYNKISQNIGCIKDAISGLKQNIYSLFIIENLLLKLKERKK